MSRTAVALAALALVGCATPSVAPPVFGLGQPPYRLGSSLTVYVGTPAEVSAQCWEKAHLRNVGGCWYTNGGQDYVVVPHPESVAPEGAFWVLLHEFKHVMEGGFHD